MSKKLQGNGLFESSRMMLPEHKEAYLRQRQDLSKKTRPQLDEQEVERISMILAESMQLRKEVILVLFGELDRRELSGKVTRMDQQQKRVQFTHGDDSVWVQVADIVDVIC
ncbi:YolD-like protein [Chlamydia abortus]|uniref:YolD-like family protein n=1 Tax=Paenibacillus sp. 32O-W TaxID=1695218 RepID=UPI000A27B9A1|nr:MULTISPECIES: YolD-like family protein [Paenibacillaceae]SHE11649.1 YolD-like protein [Chlamydia abortus]